MNDGVVRLKAMRWTKFGGRLIAIIAHKMLPPGVVLDLGHAVFIDSKLYTIKAFEHYAPARPETGFHVEPVLLN